MYTVRRNDVLKYKLIGDNDTNNIIKTALHNRGIEDWEQYINLQHASRETYKNLDKIQEAVELFDKHFQAKNPIAILMDNDTDGICSTTIMYKFIKSMSENYDVRLYVHERNKSHGLDGDFNIDDDISLLIVPDAGSNDIKQHQELKEQGIDCICLDHHQVTADISKSPAIIVNNQISNNYTNKDCCGASITLEFCRALQEYYWEDICDDLVDLVGIANICDSMSLLSFETRATVNEGLGCINNKMLQEIIKAQDFSMKGIVSPHTVAFCVGPLINAFIRMATYEERQLLVRAFCEDESETFEYTKRGEDFPTAENIYEHVVRLAKSYKSKQDRQRKKALPQLVDMANNSTDKVAIIDSTGIIDSSLTGVVAIRVAETLNKPTVLLQKRNDNEYGGSARAFDHCPVEDLRNLIDTCPYTNYAQGHASACGISIPIDNVEATKQWLNEQLADMSMDKIYDVDFEVEANELEAQIFLSLDNYKTLWARGVDEPLFAIKDLHITSENAKICGKKQDTIQIYDEETDVKYIMFFCKEDNEFYQWISSNWGDQEADITVVGTLGLNYYEGKLDSQVVIKDVQINETIQN